MPKPRPPPTPSSSTDIVGLDKAYGSDMESVFILPPPAWQPKSTKATSKSRTHSAMIGQETPPLSPTDKEPAPTKQRKRTLSGCEKSCPQDPPTMKCDPDASLPPPPSRARKIIQMKPKQVPRSNSEDFPTAPIKPAIVQKEPATVRTSSGKGKRAQPSATSAAGRKIARKTAHSIIERRRRSKMNEEFGVLRDMIPACAGVDMHKLAILQAGIEYVRYLEDCIEQLKAQNENKSSRQSAFKQVDMENNHMDDGDMDIDYTNRLDEKCTEISSAEAGEPEFYSTPAVKEIPPSESKWLIPPPRESSVTTSATNSTFVSPELRPVESNLSLPSLTNITTSQSRMGPPLHMAQSHSNHSVSPPLGIIPNSNETGMSPAFGAFDFGPELTKNTSWPSTYTSATQDRLLPSILPTPQTTAAVPLSLPPLSQMYALTHKSENIESSAEANATAALMMMTKDRRATGSGKSLSVRDLLSS